MTLDEFNRAHFQQDGAPAHTSRRAQLTLREMFGDRVIGRGGIEDWPPRSPDLNPLDFFLSGHVKGLVYRESVADRADLEARIVAALRSVTREMLRRCGASLLRRARLCIEMAGGHFEHLL